MEEMPAQGCARSGVRGVYYADLRDQMVMTSERLNENFAGVPWTRIPVMSKIACASTIVMIVTVVAGGRSRIRPDKRF
jgi:hypothetical protein